MSICGSPELADLDLYLLVRSTTAQSGSLSNFFVACGAVRGDFGSGYVILDLVCSWSDLCVHLAFSSSVWSSPPIYNGCSISSLVVAFSLIRSASGISQCHQT